MTLQLLHQSITIKNIFSLTFALGGLKYKVRVCRIGVIWSTDLNTIEEMYVWDITLFLNIQKVLYIVMGLAYEITGLQNTSRQRVKSLKAA